MTPVNSYLPPPSWRPPAAVAAAASAASTRTSPPPQSPPRHPPPPQVTTGTPTRIPATESQSSSSPPPCTVVDQRLYLEQCFKTHPHPNISQRSTMASRLGWSDGAIKVWFEAREQTKDMKHAPFRDGSCTKGGTEQSVDAGHALPTSGTVPLQCHGRVSGRQDVLASERRSVSYEHEYHCFDHQQHQQRQPYPRNPTIHTTAQPNTPKTPSLMTPLLEALITVCEQETPLPTTPTRATATMSCTPVSKTSSGSSASSCSPAMMGTTPLKRTFCDREPGEEQLPEYGKTHHAQHSTHHRNPTPPPHHHDGQTQRHHHHPHHHNPPHHHNNPSPPHDHAAHPTLRDPPFNTTGPTLPPDSNEQDLERKKRISTINALLN